MKIIKIAVPKELLKAAHDQEIKNKPHDLCHVCPFSDETCTGPDFLAMTNESWIDWANKKIKHLKLTHKKLSEKSGIPSSTISSVLSGRVHDLRHSTMRDITRTLVGGYMGKYPCHFAALLLDGNFVEDTDTEDVIIKEQLESAKSNLARAELEAQKKIDFLKERLNKKERQLYWIMFAMLIVFVLILCVLIYDMTHRDIGYFRW